MRREKGSLSHLSPIYFPRTALLANLRPTSFSARLLRPVLDDEQAAQSLVDMFSLLTPVCRRPLSPAWVLAVSSLFANCAEAHVALSSVIFCAGWSPTLSCSSCSRPLSGVLVTPSNMLWSYAKRRKNRLTPCSLLHVCGTGTCFSRHLAREGGDQGEVFASPSTQPCLPSAMSSGRLKGPSTA